MKSEKVCINKSIAFIVAVVAVLLGVVLFANYMNSQSLSGNSRAAGECYYTFDTVRYQIPDQTCFKDVIKAWTSTTLRCDKGNAVPDNSCITPAKAVCLYGNQEVGAQGSAYGLGATFCVVDSNGDAFGYRCKTVKDKQGNETLAAGRNSAYSDTVNCKGKAPEAVCLYGNEDVNKSNTYSMDASTFCILENNKPIEYKCKTVKDANNASVLAAGRNSAFKDAACRDTTPAAAQCLYGGEVVGAQGSSYTMDQSSFCVLNAQGEKFGIRCRTVKDQAGTETLAAGRNSAYSDTVNCKGKPAAAACLYGGEVVGAQGSSYGMDPQTFCVLNAKGNPFSYRCRTVKDAQNNEVLADGRNSAYSNLACAPKCSQQQCGTVEYGKCDAKKQMCKCVNPDSTTEKPQLVYDDANCP